MVLCVLTKSSWKWTTRIVQTRVVQGQAVFPLHIQALGQPHHSPLHFNVRVYASSILEEGKACSALSLGLPAPLPSRQQASLRSCLWDARHKIQRAFPSPQRGLTSRQHLLWLLFSSLKLSFSFHDTKFSGFAGFSTSSLPCPLHLICSLILQLNVRVPLGYL